MSDPLANLQEPVLFQIIGHKIHLKQNIKTQNKTMALYHDLLRMNCLSNQIGQDVISCDLTPCIFQTMQPDCL